MGGDDKKEDSGGDKDDGDDVNDDDNNDDEASAPSRNSPSAHGWRCAHARAQTPPCARVPQNKALVNF